MYYALYQIVYDIFSIEFIVTKLIHFHVHLWRNWWFICIPFWFWLTEHLIFRFRKKINVTKYLRLSCNSVYLKLSKIQFIFITEHISSLMSRLSISKSTAQSIKKRFSKYLFGTLAKILYPTAAQHLMWRASFPQPYSETLSATAKL